MLFISGLSLTLQILVYALILIIGAFFLVKFCNLFVDSSSSIAKKFGIPPLIVGLTVVAMGTSFPELAVSVSDSINSLIDGSNANIGFSNVVGSNLSNLLLVLAFSSLFTPVLIKKETKRDYLVLTGITIVFTTFSLLFGGLAILRWEAIILVCFIFFYITYIVLNAKKQINKDEAVEDKKTNVFKDIVFLVLGIIGVVVGGELVVYGAKGIALNIASSLNIDMGLAETLIGLTIVAVGTSLPELVTTIIASKKNENDMALGNVIGSNIFNIIFVLGISATIAPFTISSYMIVDLIVLLFVTILVLVFVLRGKLTRKHSVCLIMLYTLYVVYLVVRTLVGG